MEDFGRYLKSLRTAQGLSRPALRDKIRDRFGAGRAMSTSTLENWENGKIDGMSAGALARLVVVLGADYEDVFSRLVTAQLSAQDDRVPGGGSPARGAARRIRQPQPGNGSTRRSR